MRRKYAPALDELSLDDFLPGFPNFASTNNNEEFESAQDDEDEDSHLDSEASAGSLRAGVSEDPVQFYLRSIGKIKLLTATEEIELARRIAKGDMLAKKR